MRIHGQELWADVEVRVELLRDAERIRGALRAGAAALRSTVLSEHVQTFEPSGLTAIVVIGESHLLASTYEELGLVAVNIQTCTSEMDLIRGLGAVCAALESEEVRDLVLMRRLDSPFRIVLQAERVAVRDGELELDGAAAARQRLRLLGEQRDQVAVPAHRREATVEGGEGPGQRSGRDGRADRPRVWSQRSAMRSHPGMNRMPECARTRNPTDSSKRRKPRCENAFSSP